MKTVVQARLDEDTRKDLDRLVRNLGLSASEIVREGIRLVKEQHAKPRPKKIVGLGQFDSGITDLGSNKKHLEGYGR
ncbi:Arc/MetJ-type ribon-helix-helix transcriptional regulator [Silvibacterium bohemicum]|uniref:Arc/MetJ-type ribon-helix-helix transcriptional regulator n=1 Tax=Silvibacterium bohemicum TaxID=1577686 RepID=A0A841K1C4_9BACT|nr:ribbon-helix-helix protein, CopG family [Silvibacterium bohemicum]MBB6146397.1 Arc/MetJ-type ribon-helix-helix transcriptional regulator [Silvibacterium bohemicum]